MASTFEFSEEDYTRIMLEESLFGSQASSSHMADAETTKRLIAKLQAREVRLHLHAVSLSDYLRQRRIPRGLRLQKEPMIGKDNDSFCTKWCDIMNKCSFDLMALSIQELSEQLKNTRAEIERIKKDSVTETFTQDRLDTVLAECEQQKRDFEKEIKSMKVKKFERDANDYANNRVYPWRSKERETHPGRDTHHGGPFAGRHQRGRRPWRQQPRDYTSASSFEIDSDSSSYSNRLEPFLGFRQQRGDSLPPPRGGRRGRNARKNAGEARGDDTQDRYWMRSSKKNAM